MYVVKRNGKSERLSFDKITLRISKLCYNLDSEVDAVKVSQKVIAGLTSGVTTSQIDQEAARKAAQMVTFHPHYSVLAARLAVTDLHRRTEKRFSELVEKLHGYVHEKTGRHMPLVSDELLATVRKHKDALDAAIIHNRDMNFTYFGLRTLMRSYLLKMHGEVVESPQHMYMRVALGIHGEDIERTLHTYDLLSKGILSHASPTMFNSGTPNPQMASCFLLQPPGDQDSIDSIYRLLYNCAVISKTAGGIGFTASTFRARGSYIAGTNGTSNGLVPLLRNFNATARYVDQGGNKRPGAFACFAADTEIMTVNAGVKPIQEVEIGDLVVTHLNRVRPVVQLHKNPLGDRKLYKLKVEKTKEVIVTGNHKFWSSWNTMVAKGWHSVEELKALMDTKTCYISIPSDTGIPEKSVYDQLDLKDFSASILSGIDALEEAPGDKLVPLTFYTDQHGNTGSHCGQMVNRFWTVNEDLVKLFGMWLGDGCIRKSKEGKITGVAFKVHEYNVPEMEFIKQTCQTAFGCTTPSSIIRSEWQVIIINSDIVGAVFMALFGSDFNDKHLPNMVFGWPLKLVNHLMAGLIITEGHVSEKHHAMLPLSNPALMNQLYHLCRNNGLDVSLTKALKSEKMTPTMSIPLSREILDSIHKLYHLDPAKAGVFANLAAKDQNDSDKFLQVLDIAEVDRADEWVYTLGVEEDHSYTVEGGLIVANCYLEPWHADVFEWLELKLQGGIEEMRARDLFYALWVPDLFMRRVEQDADWTLMCPHECPGLCEVWGKEFEDLYTKYEREGKGMRTIRAQELWFQILRLQKETGTPYMLYKDACNRASNQQNLGTIKQSNLCVAADTEVLTEYGPQSILTLATAHEAKGNDEETEERIKTTTQLQVLEERLKLVSNEKKIQKLKSEIRAVKAKLEALPDPAGNAKKAKGPKPIKVWNGKAWSEVVAKKTAEKVPLIRITTSHGSIIDCTRGHQFILEDGATRVDAQNLVIGSRLVKTPPTRYVGMVKYELHEADAFRRGFIYAYGVMKKGTDPACLGPRPPSFKVPCLVIPKANVTKETLEKLGYDEKVVRKQAPREDHETLAFVPVREGEQALQTRTMAPEETRRAWVTGFLTACGGKLDEVRGSHVLLKRPRMMFRSVGEDARLSPAGRDGVWHMHWPETGDDGVPVVTSIQDMGAVEDTYCFTEEQEHAGVFNEQLTGQCSEIIEYTSPDQVAVCNLCSIALSKFVHLHGDDDHDELRDGSSIGEVGTFQFDRLHAVVKDTVVNMNRVIDRNLYLLEDMKRSNLAHRPIGIGVQGLADTFAMLRLPWEESWGVPYPDARRLNQQIFETMYHAALEASCELAEAEGTYVSYAGSPASQGKLQFDLWGVTPTGLWDWDALKAKIARHGLRNSLLLTCMPTASTAQILGNNESIEPFTTNMYTRKVLSGEFQVVNKYLVYELVAEGLWDDDMRQEIMAHSGSVQNILRIPKHIRDVYKTVWEISQQTLIDMAADRGAFICQSQSFNLHMSDPTDEQLSAAHFYGWERGLKTGMYYLRSKPATDAIKFTLDPALVAQAKQQTQAAKTAAVDGVVGRIQEDIDAEEEERITCSRNNPGACTMCSG